MLILVTGGAGYIGSHACVELLQAGHDVVIMDNLSNSKHSVLKRIERITGRVPAFVEADLRDNAALNAMFVRYRFGAVMHFAGLKAVGESVAQPLYYYDNNVHGSLGLLRVMQQHGVKTLVFSSSATVYGEPESLPINEDAPLHQAANPYGRCKQMVEAILRDLATSDVDWRIAILRYFNPVGAHQSGLIGEAPNGTPNNLFPYMLQVAAGQRKYLSVFGNNYPTPDGTGVRDYIHVVDLVLGHLRALEQLNREKGVFTYNLGTGQGYSVLEMVKALELISGQSVPYRLTARRPGDIAICYADPGRAQRYLGWIAERGIEVMCRDAWRWQTKGYLE